MLQKKFTAILIIFCFLAHAGWTQSVFTSFEVEPGAGCSIIIQWTIDPASDTLDLVIERSVDKKTWQVAGRMPVRASHRYVSFDNDPLHGYNYYRARQLDTLNRFRVSAIKSVQVNKNNEIFIWPNPSGEKVYVKTTFLSGLIDVVDANGRLVLSVAITNFITPVTTIPLAKGIYFLHIRNGNIDITEKLVKE